MHGLVVALTLLHGIVTMGPTQPVCQVGVPCSKPAANIELVFTRSTGATARAQTDGKGRYSIKLARGIYTVAVKPPRRIGTGVQPRRFTIHTGPQRLDFDVDTGIR